MNAPIKKSHLHIIVFLGMIALVLSLFGKTLNHRFNSDDYLVVYHASESVYSAAEAAKEYVRPSWGLYYRPSITLFFNVLESWFGTVPIGYHFVSLLCYSVLCIEVYALAMLLGRRVTVALAAALIFLTMTSHAEAIFWISSLNGVVENIFSLASLLCFIRWRQRQQARLYLFALLLFILALFLKESAVVLPAVLILYDVLLGGPLRWPDSAKRAAAGAWPFVLSGLIFVMLRGLVMRQLHLPASLTTFRVKTSVLGFWHTLLMTCSPFDWAIGVRWLEEREAAGFFFYVLAAIALVALGLLPLLLKKHRVAFLLGWILAGTGPVIGLGLVPSERHVVFSSAGAAVLIALALFKVAERLHRTPLSQNVLALFLSVIFSATNLYYLSQRQTAWKMASNMASSIVEQTRIAYPSPVPGETFFFLNVPDTYDGAFVFRFDNLTYALRLCYNEPSLQAVRIISPERIRREFFSDLTYAYFRISAMGGNVTAEKTSRTVEPEIRVSDIAFLARNSVYADDWPRYQNSPFLTYSYGYMFPSSREKLKKVLQELYSVR